MAEFKKIDQTAVEAARRRGERSFRGPRAVSASLDQATRRIVIRFAEGPDFLLDPQSVGVLRSVPFDDLADVVIEGAGHAIHFPALDIDLAIPPLLGSTTYDIDPHLAEA